MSRRLTCLTTAKNNQKRTTKNKLWPNQPPKNKQTQPMAKPAQNNQPTTTYGQTSPKQTTKNNLCPNQPKTTNQTQPTAPKSPTTINQAQKQRNKHNLWPKQPENHQPVSRPKPTKEATYGQRARGFAVAQVSCARRGSTRPSCACATR